MRKDRFVIISKCLVFFFIFIFLLSFDVYTKHLAERYLVKELTSLKEKGEIIYFVPEKREFLKTNINLLKNYISLNYTRNFDIGFSLFNNFRLLNNLSDVKLSRIVLLIQITSFFIIFIFFIRYNFSHYWAFLFIISGGFGNIVDRYMNGYVTDFISIRLLFLKNIYNWPIFNVADIYVTLGAIFFLIDIFIHKKHEN